MDIHIYTKLKIKNRFFSEKVSEANISICSKKEEIAKLYWQLAENSLLCSELVRKQWVKRKVYRETRPQKTIL